MSAKSKVNTRRLAEGQGNREKKDDLLILTMPTLAKEPRFSQLLLKI